ncbi:MAG TPA: hypothetical protein VIM12_17935 [Noviherbaspirillum sp.]|jgi:hypothetical protein|uniref:hypothetical protein n=1 Tax=Noviherbaspirillum sp. TaxID=1926288 RepID=UPI002F921448
MNSFFDIGLFALGFAALLRDAHYLRKGAVVPALLWAAVAWAALMARGIFHGPPRPIEEHVGFGFLYALVFFGVTGVALFLGKRGRR